MLLWGSGPGANKKNPMYGLLRPTLSGASSVVVNNYDARVELYPISFLGFAAGRRHIQSSFEDFPFYNCEQVRCAGTIDRDYTQVKAAIGFGRFVTMANIIQSKNTYSDEDNEGKPVAEFRFATLANAKEDTMYRSQYVLAYKHSTGLIGIVAEYVKFDESDQTNNMDLLIYTTKSKSTTYVFGVGQFTSTHVAQGLIGVFQMRTDFLPSSKMF